MKKTLILMCLFCISALSMSQTWIWYPGDYEIWLGNEMNNRRTERGAFFPPFWKIDSHYAVIEFSKKITLKQPEEIEIAVEGRYNIKLNGKLQFGEPKRFTLPAGEHSLNIKVYNQATPPALYIKGETINTDPSWLVTFEDKEWIDESGKASDTSATTYMNVGYWNFNAADKKPSEFRLETQAKSPVKRTKLKEGELIDFGVETFGYISLHGLKGNGGINLYYGESPEEALDTEYCETLDRLQIESNKISDLAINKTTDINTNYTLTSSKAFRYVYLQKTGSVSLDSIGMLYEYLPVNYRGSFRCNDDELNKIWDIGAYTMHLTTREFFIDGIKRDRWVWSGDAIQSYLMNYYLFFDSESVKRTIWLVRGKDPVTSHTNTIMDYTLYWFLSIYDYYIYSGDKEFVAQIYPRMQTLMDYVLGRTNQNGMLEGMTGDWVFVDWADGYLDKKGELSFEQVLFCKSLETMSLCANLVDNKNDIEKYSGLADNLRQKLLPAFWDESKKALVHNRVDGKQSDSVTRYANMFSVFFNYLDIDKKQAIKNSVLFNNDILKITTPYMRFYELEALCALGEQEAVMQEMKSYWGGMLNEGATTFWEKYNPEDTGTEHLAMYGRPYGKSLCHAWGASPIYLLGKYYLGISPTKPGYKEFEIKPCLGGLKWMQGSVPTPQGSIDIYMDTKNIKVKTSGGSGYLYIKNKRMPKVNYGKAEQIEPNSFKIWIDTTAEIIIKL